MAYLDGRKDECAEITGAAPEDVKVNLEKRLVNLKNMQRDKVVEFHTADGSARAIDCELQYLKNFARGGIIPGGK